MARPSRYDEAARRLIAEMGIGREIKTTAQELAELIDLPAATTTRTLNVMQRAGTATLRNEWLPETGGRHVFYTITGDYSETVRRMKEKGLVWSEYHEALAKGAKPKAYKPKRPLVERNYVEATRLADNTSNRPFSSLSPLRKSEPRAELEVARRYRDQQAFLVEQKQRFAEMGLSLPEVKSDLTLDRKIELDALVRILPYIETIERANERLEEQNKNIRQPLAELNELRGIKASQKAHIERMVAEKAAIQDDVREVLEKHKREVTGYRERIAALEVEVRRLRGDQAINGAIAVTKEKPASAA